MYIITEVYILKEIRRRNELHCFKIQYPTVNMFLLHSFSPRRVGFWVAMESSLNSPTQYNFCIFPRAQEE